jgi:N-acetyl-anhydromuramyl-L-alanine amidase AmpD
MAIYPHGTAKLLPENGTQRKINPTQVIVHSAVDAPGNTSLYSYFGRTDVVVESHFFVKLDGAVEQYIDTTVQADANYEANVRAISIETEDDGDPDHRPWSEAQLAALRELIHWLCLTHDIPVQVCPAWDKPGVGYHTLFGAPSKWTPAVGKTCPGKARIPQFHELLDWITPTPVAPPTVLPTLSEGSTGRLVKDLQEKVGVKADGIFGPKTAAAVKEFQRPQQAGRWTASSGSRTWTALRG